MTLPRCLLVERPGLDDLREVLASIGADELRQYAAQDDEPLDIEVAAAAMAQDPITHVWRDSDGRPYCVAGYEFVTPTVMRSWMLASANTRRDQWARITATSREVMAWLLDHGILRLETWCLADRAQARAWYEKLGLKLDGVLPCYGLNGEAFAIYSRTEEPAHVL